MTDAIVLDYQRPRTSSLFYYGWVNVAVAALAMVATMPGRTYGLGLITEPILKELRITPVEFANQNLWATLIGALFSLACGPLIDRFGTRNVLAVVLALLGATVVAMSRIVSPNGLLITMTLTRGFGQSALSAVSLALVGKWFSRRLPIAMAVYSVLVGVGFAVAMGAFPHVVTVHGWRHAWGALGWILLAGVTPVSWLLARRTPESIGLVVDGLPAETEQPAPDDSLQTGVTLKTALRSPAFWAFALAASLFGLVNSGMMLFNESVLRERGFDKESAGAVLAVIMLSALLANFLGGWLAGIWPLGRLMAGAMFALAIGLLALPLMHGRASIFCYGVMMGISGGIVTVCFFICWGKVFGRRHLGAIQGAAQGLTVLASAFGPVLLAVSTHHYGSATPLFFISAPVICLLGVFCALTPFPTIPGETGEMAPSVTMA